MSEAPNVADLAVVRQAAKRQAVNPDEAATHHQLAVAFVDSIEDATGTRPVAAEGRLWRVNDRGLWLPLTVDQVGVEIARRFSSGLKNCKRGSDYTQIAKHVLATVESEDFFATAPVGVVTPTAFWRITADKRLARTELEPDHRQRHAIAVDPDFDADAPRWWRYLESIWRDDDLAAQTDLAAELVGAGLFGLARSMAAAGLLIGPGAAGKSTFLQIVEALFPSHFVSAVSPASWAREYNVAGLAGRRLNIVGELPEGAPLPAAAFKNVTGGDLLEGRHPNHRPFWFKPEALHLFSTNSLPATTDRSDAFFRRWRVLRFIRSIPVEERDPGLADAIIGAELPRVLAWAMQGAERAAQRGRLGSSRAHEEVLRRWRVGSNPVLRFLTDPEACQLEPGERTRTSLFYGAYSEWAKAQGAKPMSSPALFELLDTTAGDLGVSRGRSEAERYVQGVRVTFARHGLFDQG